MPEQGGNSGSARSFTEAGGSRSRRFPPIGRFTVETPRKALCGKGLHNFFVEKRSDEINVFILQIRVLNQNHENVFSLCHGPNRAVFHMPADFG